MNEKEFVKKMLLVFFVTLFGVWTLFFIEYYVPSRVGLFLIIFIIAFLANIIRKKKNRP